MGVPPPPLFLKGFLHGGWNGMHKLFCQRKGTACQLEPPGSQSRAVLVSCGVGRCKSRSQLAGMQAPAAAATARGRPGMAAGT